MENEVWKNVVGYDGYMVSNLGRVMSYKRYKEGRMLHPTTSTQGRVSVMLVKKIGVYKRVSLHKVVAMAFVENPFPDKYTEINHKDENPLNNNADNLEWCDRPYNMHYNGLMKRIKRYRKPIIGIGENGMKVSFASRKEAKKAGFEPSGIWGSIYSPLKNGKQRQYKGFYWREA